MKSQYLYKNITISGLPGAGSSTLGKSLASQLEWQYFGGGDFMRAYAIEKGLFDGNAKVHHDASVYTDDFDKQVDFQARKWLQDRTHQVIDAWLSGFMAQGLKDVLKVLVICSDDAIRVDRVVNRDEVSVEEAKKHIFEREEKNFTKWRRLYAKEWEEWIVKTGKMTAQEPINFWAQPLYDLVIDTYYNSKEETLEKVIAALEGKTS